MTEEERKDKQREYQKRYEAKDPVRRREQKRLAARRYYEKNRAKCMAKTKECDAKRKAKDPEAFAAKAREYNLKHRRKKGIMPRVLLSPEVRKENARRAVRDWAKKNPQYFLEWTRADREANPEKYYLKDKGRKKDPVKQREYNRKAKHSRRGDESHLGPIDLVAYDKTLEAFDFKCIYCRDDATTIDHVVAIKQGGTNHHTNLVPACTRCNSSKGKKHLGQWLKSSYIAKEALSRPWDWQPPQEECQAAQ